MHPLPSTHSSAITFPIKASTCIRFVRTWPHFAYLRLHDFRDRYGLLGHFHGNGFDRWLFHFRHVCPSTTIDTIVVKNGRRALTPMRWGRVVA